MNNPIHVALVGAGYMATEHARAFASLPNVRIVGVCGRSRQRAQVLADSYGARVFDDVATMHRETDAALVVVAVNELSMRGVCESVFSHPWTCLLEKPVGLDLAEAQTLLDASRRSGSRALVALNRRAYASTRQAMAELNAGHGPRLVSVLDQQDLVAAAAGGQPPAVVRNYMYANSLHLVDYFNHFCRGQVTAVHNTLAWNAAAPGHVVATVRYDSGDCGVYQAVWDGPGPWSVTVTNHDVRIELRPLERLGTQRRGERRLTDATADPIDSEFKPGLRWQAEQALAAMRGEPHGLATLADATRSMELVADLYGLRARR
jgi:predicted dehydrogenase